MKKIIIAVILSLVAVVAIFLYFVNGISSTYPPIEKYQYSSNFSQFIEDLNKLSSINKDIFLKIKDTTGDKEASFAFYMKIEIRNNKNDFQYDLKFEQSNFDNQLKTNNFIEIIGVFDNIKNIGGYRKNFKGYEEIMAVFDSSILRPLKINSKIRENAFLDVHTRHLEIKMKQICHLKLQCWSYIL